VSTTSYYLLFTNEEIKNGDTSLKTYPPIRNKSNMNLLWDCLKLKAIDIITSNHSAIPAVYKMTETGNFVKAIPGI
jgi:dihydroorotase-like cyclic amidohydrolase